jgi:hypothetical protein
MLHQNECRTLCAYSACIIAVLYLCGCSGQSDRKGQSALCNNAADSCFIYHDDSYSKTVDSLFVDKFHDVPNEVTTIWSREIISTWFREKVPGLFWERCDSLFHISRVLYSCESGAVDGPTYICDALVCTDRGLLAIASMPMPSRADMDRLIIHRSVPADFATEEWIRIQLRNTFNTLSIADTCGLDPHTRGIALLKVETDGKSLMALRNGPVCDFGSSRDSLYCYIFDLLSTEKP